MEQEINKSNDLNFESKVKAKNRRTIAFIFMRIGIVLLCFVTVLVYLLTPISSLENLNIVGNIYLEKQDIYNILNISNPSKTSLYSIDKEKTEELLDEYSIIDDVEVDISLFSMNISFKENAPSAKYNDDIYCTDGEVLSDEILNDNLLTKYFEKTLINTAEFINEPNKHQYLSDYLLILSKINGLDKSIYYVETSSSEKSFILYYKASGNSSYFRVNLIYDDNISLEYYVRALTPSLNLINGFNNALDGADSESLEHNGEILNYYSLRVTLDVSDEIKLSIQKDI